MCGSNNLTVDEQTETYTYYYKPKSGMAETSGRILYLGLVTDDVLSGLKCNPSSYISDGDLRHLKRLSKINQS